MSKTQPTAHLNDYQAFMLILILGSLIYLLNICWAPGLLDDADSVHAEAAREMVVRGDYSTLYINGLRYLEKAPFMYWLMAIGFRIFGPTEFIARLPLAISAIALMFACFLFARWAFGQLAGLYAAIIVGTSIGIFLFTRILIPDVMVALWITLNLYCFLRALEAIETKQNALPWLAGLYSTAALMVLTKGLIGMVFPGGIIFWFLVLRRKFHLLFKFRLLSGTLLFLLIAAPWHIIAGLNNENPNGHGFFWFYFVNEHFLRYLGKRYPVDYDKVPIVLFYALHLLWLFPWSLFAPLYQRIKAPTNELASALTETAQVAHQRRYNMQMVLLLWPLLIILFFSFSTRQEYYTYPAWPAFAILLAIGLTQAEENSALRRRVMGARAILMAIGILFLLSAIVLIGLSLKVTDNQDISQLLTRNPEYYALSLGHIFDLTPQSFAALRVPLAGAALAFFLGGCATFWFGRRNQHLYANLAVAVMMAIFFFFSQQAMWVFEPYLSSKSLALAIKSHLQPGDEIIINGEYESGSSVNFYTEQPVMILNNRTANLEFGSYFPDAPQRFLTTPELVQHWDQPDKRVFIVTDQENLKALYSMLPNRNIVELATSGGKVLLANRHW